MIKYKRVRWAEHIARTEYMRGTYKVLVGKPVGKRLRVRPKRRWENNIKKDLREGDRKTCTGVIWFRIEAGGRLL